MAEIQINLDKCERTLSDESRRGATEYARQSVDVVMSIEVTRARVFFGEV